MESLDTVITIFFWLAMLICPILLVRFIHRSDLKYKLIVYLISGLILLFFIMYGYAWWSYTIDLVLLKQYGYDIDGMNANEFYDKVLPENMDKVKQIEKSVMGIGWPLKAVMSFIVYSPYLLIVYGVSYIIKMNRSK